MSKLLKVQAGAHKRPSTSNLLNENAQLKSDRSIFYDDSEDCPSEENDLLIDTDVLSIDEFEFDADGSVSNMDTMTIDVQIDPYAISEIMKTYEINKLDVSSFVSHLIYCIDACELKKLRLFETILESSVDEWQDQRSIEKQKISLQNLAMSPQQKKRLSELSSIDNILSFQSSYDVNEGLKIKILKDTDSKNQLTIIQEVWDRESCNLLTTNKIPYCEEEGAGPAYECFDKISLNQ